MQVYVYFKKSKALRWEMLLLSLVSRSPDDLCGKTEKDLWNFEELLELFCLLSHSTDSYVTQLKHHVSLLSFVITSKLGGKHLSSAGRPRSEAEKQKSRSLCTSTHAIHSVNSIQKLAPADIWDALELWADLANTQRQKSFHFLVWVGYTEKKKKRTLSPEPALNYFRH